MKSRVLGTAFCESLKLPPLRPPAFCFLNFKAQGGCGLRGALAKEPDEASSSSSASGWQTPWQRCLPTAKGFEPRVGWVFWASRRVGRDSFACEEIGSAGSLSTRETLRELL